MEVNKIMITMIINKYLYNKMINFLKFGNFIVVSWVMGIGDWGLGIGDLVQFLFSNS